MIKELQNITFTIVTNGGYGTGGLELIKFAITKIEPDKVLILAGFNDVLEVTLVFHDEARDIFGEVVVTADKTDNLQELKRLLESHYMCGKYKGVAPSATAFLAEQSAGGGYE